MNGKRPLPKKKLAIMTILGAFIFSGVFGLMFPFGPSTAQAVLPVVDAPVFGATATSAGMSITERTLQGIWTALKTTGVLALMNAGRYFANRIAYDAANYIASGGSGQKPFFTTEGLTDYFQNTALDAAGEALGTLSEAGFESIGINLCSPSDPRLSLNIKLGTLGDLPGELGVPLGPSQPQPRCSWRNIKDSWTDFASQTTDQVLDQVGTMFQAGQNELSTALEFDSYVGDQIRKKVADANTDYAANAGFRPLKSRVGGYTLTPADVIRTEQQSIRDAQKAREQDQTLVAASLDDGGVAGILGSALQTFVSTLGEKMMKKIFEKGLILLSQAEVETRDLYGSFNASPPAGGRAAAELANASLLTPRILSTTNFDELTDFATCPPDSKGPSHCVIDSRFFTAVTRSTQEAPLTLKQAVEQGLLQGSWKLLPVNHPKNRDKNCYLESYCYSNLVKLRRARIIPIGWELVANSKFNDPNRPVTLKQAMDRFNDCPVNEFGEFDPAKLPDPNKPWCHLIDPNWVLKYPKTICRQQAYGPTLLSSQIASRGQVCVDTAGCIAEDASGECVGGYGYCLREKNLWRLDADACPAQYASCQSLRRADGENVSYLMNTIDRAGCNAENAGCRAYSTVQNAVPNPGFEDVILKAGGPTARDWQYDDAAAFNHSGDRSLHGVGAIAVTAGKPAAARAVSILPGSDYELSAAALQESEETGPFGAKVTVTFKDREDDSVNKVCANKKVGDLSKSCAVDADCGGGDSCQEQTFETTCTVNADGSVSFDVAVTALGYASAGCKVTTPANAVAAVIKLESDAPASNPVWFDQIGMFGSSYSAAPLDRLHFNAKAEACPGNEAGCSEFIPLDGDSLNLVRNPGFEEPNAAGDAPKFWKMAASNYDKLVSNGSEGFSSIKLSSKLNEEAVQVVGGLTSDAVYVFSMFTKASGSVETAPEGRAQLVLYDAADNAFDKADQPDCSPEDDGSLDLILVKDVDYQRSECQFTTPSGADHLKIFLDSIGADAEPILADAVQLELAVRSSSFHVGHSSTSVVRLRKAPNGLNCTGLPNDPSECAGYAPSCRRDEAGCNLYKPADGGTSVPAVISPSDVCPAACAGYDSFRQEPTNFTGSKFPLFFIPATAKACSALEAGCEEFTNLEKLARGGESRESFSYLRLCQKPDEAVGTFYTWEGNDVQGYQLRVWTLRNSNVVSEPSGTSGSDPTGGTAPCTALGYDATERPVCRDDAVPEAPGACKKSDVFFNPDCREFYDINGNIHYRLYSKTIVASDACVEYRMSRSEETGCRTYGGSWTNNECHFFGLPQESASCRLEAAGCRAYTGNAARNIRVALNDTFESGTADEWFEFADKIPGPYVANSNESVNVGGHSLKAATTQAVKDVSDAIRKDRAYLLTFWAKGNGDLTARFSRAAGDETFQRVSLTTEWRPYTVGPVRAVNEPSRDFADPFNNEQLVFEYQGTAVEPTFFLDNVVLKEIAQSIYLINDSWKTPARCDQAPNGVFSPQYMLGCQEYSDKDAKKVFLKSFDRLCREQAVGCQAMYDTSNTSSPFAQTFNAVCTLPDGPDADDPAAPDACVPDAGAVTCPCSIDDNGQQVQVCLVTKGSTTCRYDSDDDAGNKLADVPPHDGHISADGDTVRLKADSLVYLIDSPAYRCDAANVGCTEVGEPTMEREGRLVESWSTRYLKNVSEQYANTLCLRPEVSCQAYKRTDDGSPQFFKDPGNHACEFRSNVTVSGFSTSGWYRKGADEPCYPDFLESGVNYGIWKNSDEPYQGWVGECQAQYSQCKEFVDPQDTSVDHPAGQPYYAILNDRLDTKTCQNRVSLTKAPSQANDASSCVLFRQTDNLELKYGSVLTYAASEAKNGELVDPVSSASGTAPNDANLVIRVKRDRQCGQWLDCRSSETVWNESAGQYRNVCTAYAVCEKFEKTGDATRCTQYVAGETSGEVLNDLIYQSRDIGWDGLEFSGYSIPNQYPVQELTTVNIASSTSTPDLRLAYSLGSGSCQGKNSGDSCGETNALGNSGTCLGPAAGALNCVYPIDGSGRFKYVPFQKQTYSAAKYPPATCRAYPQEDSPFPSSVADPGGWDMIAGELNAGNPVLIKPHPAFGNANVCQRRVVNGVELSSCECNYQIATYGGRSGVKKYFPIESADLPTGYCEGGKYENYECDPSAIGLRDKKNLSCCSTLPKQFGAEEFAELTSVCEDGALCRPLSKIERVVGYQGQCLERDLTTPINNRPDQYACATWRPVGMVGGTRDVYNLHQTAGYFAPPDRRFYCNAQGGQDLIVFALDVATMRCRETKEGIGRIGKICGSCTWNSSTKAIDCSPDHSLCTDEDPTNNPCLPSQPRTQAVNAFFGDGVIKNALSPATVQAGDGYNNQGNLNGAWLNWPGYTNQEIVDDSTGESSTAGTTVYGLQPPPIGIFGCYQVARGGSIDQTTIEYPYIGPPIHSDQLDSIIVFTDKGISREESLVTNADQNLRVQDMGATASIDNRSLISATCNSDTNEPDGQDSLVGQGNGADRPHSLDATNDFNVEASFNANRGSVHFSAIFDDQRRFTGLKFAASASGGEGKTFAVWKIAIKFKNKCARVYQVDEPGEFGLTKANTDAVNNVRNFAWKPEDLIADSLLETQELRKGMKVDFTDYGQACRPWGSVGSVSTLPPSKPWTLIALHKRDETTNKEVNTELQCTEFSFRQGSCYECDPKVGAIPEIKETDPLQKLFKKIFGVWVHLPMTGLFFANGSNLSDAVIAGTYAPYRQVEDVADSDACSGVPFDDNLVNTTTANFYHYQPCDVTEPSRYKNIEFGRPGGTVNTYDYEDDIKPPKVVSVNEAKCDAQGHCPIGDIDTIAVNGIDGGVLYGQNGVMPVTARFYAWASHNAMPIVLRLMFWGDYAPKEPPAKGWYKNQKPYCSADISDSGAVGECAGIPGMTCKADADCPAGGSCDTGVGNHFGNTPGACFAAPYEFQHVYTCNVKDLSAMPVCNTSDPTPAGNAPCRRQVAGVLYCAYRPSVQIVDNWGWCNCAGADCKIPGGAYGEDCDPSNATAAARPWTAFNGELRLKPNDADRLKFEELLASGAVTPPSGGGFWDLFEGLSQFFYKKPKGVILTPPGGTFD